MEIIEILSSEGEEEGDENLIQKQEESRVSGEGGGKVKIKDESDDDDDIIFIQAIATSVGQIQGRQPPKPQPMKKTAQSAAAAHDEDEITFISQRNITKHPVLSTTTSTIPSYSYVPPQPQPQIAPRPIVPGVAVQTCYGMIEAALVNVNHVNVSYSHVLNTIPFAPVRISINNASQKPFRSLFFYEMDDSYPIADLNDVLCRDLSPILPMLRFDCRASVFGPHPIVRMLLYGSQSNASYIGSVLRNHTLLKPDVQPKHPYFNPQEVASNAALVGGSGSGVTDPGQRRIQDQFKSLIAAEDMPVAEPDRRLTAKLYKYQKQGLAWMQSRESGKGENIWQKEGKNWRNVITNQVEHREPFILRGGILADDMGLGKTIQIIALILTNKPKKSSRKALDDAPKPKASTSTAAAPAPKSVSERWGMFGNQQYDFGFVPPEERPKPAEDEENPLIGSLPSKCTLIVCPLSTIYNWEDQITSHSEKGSLRVLIYHGPSRTDNPETIAFNDVVITTYNILASGFTKNGGCSPLHQIYWHRVVLDEAHIIKSQVTIQAKAAFQLKTDIRWCLTGTPLQNKLDDLYSLIRFLRVEPLNKKSEWMVHIGKPIKNNNQFAFSKLQLLMKVITLRRTKTDIVDGKPIISLPPRTEEVRLLELDADERKLYDEVHRRGKAFFDRLKADGTDAVMKNYIQILQAILMMRQACLHPSLVKLDRGPVAEEDEDDLRALDTPLSLEQAKKIYHVLCQVGEDNCVLCGGCLEGAGNCVIPCKHMVCSTCISNLLGGEGSGQSSKASSSKAIVNATQAYCPLCRIPFSYENMRKIPEAEIEKAEEEEVVGDPFVRNVAARQSMGTKIRALVEDLQAAKLQDPTTKSVVFSQFTAVLNLCEKPLRDAGFKFVRLDGSMSRNNRSDAEKEFKANPRVTVFLISIKSGGVGLNLTTGNRVYLLEPYWNPAVEQQAVDRVHRLGQTRPVTTIRFIINDSVEINMQKRQRYKTALADKALDEDVLEGDSAAQTLSTSAASKNKRRKRTSSREDTLNEKMESLNILFKIN